MLTGIVYTHTEKYKIKNTFLERIQDIVRNQSKKFISSNLENSTSLEKGIRFIIEEELFNIDVTLDILFKLNDKELYEIVVSLLTKTDKINEYHLKHYTLDLVNKIIGAEYNENFQNYTIRTYSKIFNSHPLRDEILINGDYKVLIKPHPWTSKQEPLTEQIIIFDTEVEAVNVDHARSLAYNNTKNLNAYLALLLDVGFELVTSEFKIFTIKDGINFSLNRYRTGFIDYDLGLLIKDNLNGLKNLFDEESINSFHSGKETLSFMVMNEKGEYQLSDPVTFGSPNNTDFLDNVFKKHKIKKTPKNSKSKPSIIPIQKESHFPNTEILLPSDIRKYFKSISELDENTRKAFDASSRMYNLSKTVAKYEATIDKSYKVCAVESLAKADGLGFSDFIKKYNNSLTEDDKKLLDFFYSVRSGHFHSGKFYFDEFNTSLLTEIGFSFKMKQDDYFRFDKYLRTTLINWIEKVLLKKGI